MRRAFRCCTWPWLLWLGGALILGFSGCGREVTGPVVREPVAPTNLPKTAEVSADSNACMACHKEVFQSWEHSHHAWAQRAIDPAMDGKAFRVGKQADGIDQWEFSGGEDPTLGWQHGGQQILGKPTMAIGKVPLVQYLVPTEQGRYQVPGMAWDVAREEWFSIFGSEQREPKEWGHWTQRGMNWNSQCAWCHMTDFRKGYTPETDSYQSTWAKPSIQCAQCHGPAVSNPAPGACLVARPAKLSPRVQMDNCASCHARRGELDENFRAGADFHNHFQLALPSQPGLYYADGQQRDEVYNFTSLLLSKMGHAGVTCLDCHDAHSGKTKLPVENNALCMSCHGPGSITGGKTAVRIQPTEHMFHAAGTPGGRCVDCHMRQTPYMGRDWRHDHGFHVPDPLLTKELGIPNACNQCHGDKTVDWAIGHVDTWYGKKMQRPERERTRAVAQAQAGDVNAIENLLAVYPKTEIGAWKATILRLMAPWATRPDVAKLAQNSAVDADPLVRTAAAVLLGAHPSEPSHAGILQTLRADPIKAVRVEAAWSSLEAVAQDTPVAREIEAWIRQSADQPGGALRHARWMMKQGDHAAVEAAFRRAIVWDATSALPRREFSVYLAGRGRLEESVSYLEEAMPIEPDSAEIPYLLALAKAELGQPDAAEKALREAIRRDPTFARAQYNLGLLLVASGQVDSALAALREAEKNDPISPDAPYARATIHAQRGEIPQAKEAAREALRRDAACQPAQELLQALP